MDDVTDFQGSWREWWLVIVVALLTAVLLLLPYLLAYLTAGKELAFTGILMNPEDTQTYFAKMLQGYDGAWLYTIPFTPEPHEGAFVGGFYLALGHLARLLGISITAVWHITRFISDLGLFLVIFHFISTFIHNTQTRWLAYWLALFGSGLGWILFLVGQPYWLGAFPVDFKQPGAHILFTALTFPHVAVGTAVTLLSILWLQQAMRGRIRYAIAAGLINIVLGIAYPFLIYLVALTAVFYFIYLSWRASRILWREGMITAVAFLIPAPLYLYYAAVLQTNAVFHAWDAQAGTPSPPWPHYLLAYGFMLLLSGWHWWRRPDSRARFAILWAWILTVAALLYAPLGPQRRFVQGVQVPLAMLTAVAFINLILPRLKQTRGWQSLIARPRYESARMARFVTTLFLLFMSLSNVYLFASVSVSAVIQQPDPLFRPQDEIEAVDWLRENMEGTAVVLGALQTGSYIAAHSGQRVVLGHWAETVDYETKTAEVAQFFAAETDDAWRQSLLQKYDISIIWFGPRERELGQFDPETEDYFEPVYVGGNITIYNIAH